MDKTAGLQSLIRMQLTRKASEPCLVAENEQYPSSRFYKGFKPAALQVAGFLFWLHATPRGFDLQEF